MQHDVSVQQMWLWDALPCTVLRSTIAVGATENYIYRQGQINTLRYDGTHIPVSSTNLTDLVDFKSLLFKVSQELALHCCLPPAHNCPFQTCPLRTKAVATLTLRHWACAHLDLQAYDKATGKVQGSLELGLGPGLVYWCEGECAECELLVRWLALQRAEMPAFATCFRAAWVRVRVGTLVPTHCTVPEPRVHQAINHTGDCGDLHPRLDGRATRVSGRCHMPLQPHKHTRTHPSTHAGLGPRLPFKSWQARSSQWWLPPLSLHVLHYLLPQRAASLSC